MKRKRATIVWGAKNIFTVRDDAGIEYDHLRIKGKLLGIDEEAHNPLAPGDFVVIEDSGSGYVVAERLVRVNAVQRWNRKRRRIQTVAANVDRLYVVTNAGEPRYRPQFVDRVLVMARLCTIDTAIVVNKSDLPLAADATRHLEILERIGYPVIRTIARADTDLDALREHARGSVVCLLGQSGAGKSTLINALVPGANLRTGEISHRYRRGRHTTTLAQQVRGAMHASGETVYIDTPGVREFDLFGFAPQRIADGFREFGAYVDRCELPGCTHIHEPGCAVREAVDREVDLALRYRSYVAILTDLLEARYIRR